MALHFLVLFKRKKVDERVQESGFNDGGFVCWMDGDIAHASGTGENEGKEGAVQQSQ